MLSRGLVLTRRFFFLSTLPRFLKFAQRLCLCSFLLCFQVMASMVLQQSVVESLLGFTAAVAEQCGDLLDGQSVDLEVGGGGDGDVFFG